MMRTLKQLKRSMIAMLLVVCMICTNTLPAFADQAVASTMRLAKTEGKVSVTNKNGRDMGTMADMKLFNGYNLGTEQASYAWIGLDDSKIVKLDAVSEAEIQKKGKDLEVLLNSGNLFFNVTESLKADETLNIRTSTMVTGIRGTCGWVKVLDSWRTEVFILEGSVECWVMDPVTGQAKTVRLGAGQKATFVVYDQMREGDKCDIIMGTYGENDIDPFVAVELLNDPDLRDRVGGATGFNIGAIVNGAEERLDAKEQDVNQKNQVVQNQLFNQPNTVKDPVFETSRDDGGQSSGSGGGSGSGGSSSGGTSGGGNTTIPGEELDPEPEEVDTIELQMPVTAAELNEALQNHNVKLLASKVDDYNTLEVDTTVTVPNRDTADKQVTELAVDEAVTISVNQGCELRINGTLDTEGSIINYGTITNTSKNTLNIAGALENSGEITNTGKIVVAGQKDINGNYFVNNGYFTNSGVIASDQYVFAGGTFEIMAGSELYGADGQTKVTDLTLQGGGVNMMAGEFTSVSIEQGVLTMGGTSSVTTIDINDEGFYEEGGAYGSDEYIGHLIVNSGKVQDLNITTGRAVIYGGNITGLVDIDGGYMSIDGIEVNGGNVNKITCYNGEISVTAGEVTSIVNDHGDIFVSGGDIDTISLEQLDGVPDHAGSTIITSGHVETLTHAIGGLTIAEDADITTLWSDGAVSIEGGTIGTVTLDSADNATMSAGTITDGMKVIDSTLDDGRYANVIITGGTINAGSSNAAIDVNAVVNDNVDTTEPNVVIEKDNETNNVPVVIDGGDKTAILVNAGVVEADITDMVDTVDNETGEVIEAAKKSVKIKANSIDNIIKISDTEDAYAYAYVPTIDDDGEESKNDLKEVTPLYAKEDGYVLKDAQWDIEKLIAETESGDTVQLKGSFEEVVLVLNNDASINGEVIIDLNGNPLRCHSLTVGEDAGLKIIDSIGRGTFGYYTEIDNNGSLTFDDIDIFTVEDTDFINNENGQVIINNGTWNHSRVNNNGTLKINDTDITQNYSTESAPTAFKNAVDSELIVEGGEWSLETFSNYGSVSMDGVTAEATNLFNDSSAEIVIDNGIWDIANVNNYGDMTITNADVTQAEAIPDVRYVFRNYEDGELTIENGEWYFDNFDNYGKVTVGNTDVEVKNLYNELYAELTIEGGNWIFTEYNYGVANDGTMKMKDVSVELAQSLCNYGTLSIVDGYYKGTAENLINSFGSLTISGSTKLEKDRIDMNEMLIMVSGGTADIKGTGNDTVIELSCTNGSSSALICNSPYMESEETDDVVWESTITLQNVKIDSGKNSAICLDAGNKLIIDEGVQITSESEYGAIWCTAIADEGNDYIALGSPIKFEGGTITNKHDKSGVINQNYYYGRIEGIDSENIAVSLTQIKTEMLDGRDNCYSTVLVPSVDQIKTTLVAERGNGAQDKFGSTGSTIADLLEVISNSYDVYYGEGDHVVEYLAYTSSNAQQTASVSLMSLRPATPSDAETATDSDAIEGDLPDDNDDLGGSGDDDVIGDSSDNDDDDDTSSGNIGTGTDTNATEQDGNTETASGGNATGNGDPMTGSPAAIPLAAALLGIWMSMPKEYKRRNRKEC